MKSMFIAAQVCGVINFTTYGLSIWMKRKKDMLLFQIIGNLADIIQYLCLGAYIACGLNIISLIRNILFRKKECNRILLLGIILSYLICGIFTFDTVFSAISILCVIIQTVLVYQKEEQYIRIGAVLIILYWILYDFIYGAYVATMLDCIILLSNIAASVHYRKKT